MRRPKAGKGFRAILTGNQFPDTLTKKATRNGGLRIWHGDRLHLCTDFPIMNLIDFLRDTVFAVMCYALIVALMTPTYCRDNRWHCSALGYPWRVLFTWITGGRYPKQR